MRARKLGGAGWILGAALLSIGAVGPVLAGNYVLTPYGPVQVPQRKARNPYAQRARKPAAQANKRRPTVNVKSDGQRASIDLTSEVQALKGRHDALVAKLPADLRRLDPKVMATVDRLPPLAQFSYLTTVEDYPTLLSGDQGHLRTLMTGVSDLSDKDRDRFVEGAGKSFGTLEADATQFKAARNQPHATCFKLNTDLNALSNPLPAATKTDASAASTTTSTTPAATSTTPSTPAAKPRTQPKKKISGQ